MEQDYYSMVPEKSFRCYCDFEKSADSSSSSNNNVRDVSICPKYDNRDPRLQSEFYFPIITTTEKHISNSTKDQKCPEKATTSSKTQRSINKPTQKR